METCDYRPYQESGKRKEETVNKELDFENKKEIEGLDNEKVTTHLPLAHWYWLFHVNFAAKHKRIKVNAYKLNLTVALKEMGSQKEN